MDPSTAKVYVPCADIEGFLFAETLFSVIHVYISEYFSLMIKLKFNTWVLQ